MSEPFSDREADEMAEDKELRKERSFDANEIPQPIISERGWGDIFDTMLGYAMSCTDKQRGV